MPGCMPSAIDSRASGLRERSQHADVDRVYANLRCGSRNHQRAYAGQIGFTTGLPYAAQVLPQAEVDAILATGQERCGN